MTIIGYARTSTRDQEAGLQAQIRDLIAAGYAVLVSTPLDAVGFRNNFSAHRQHR